MKTKEYFIFGGKVELLECPFSPLARVWQLTDTRGVFCPNRSEFSGGSVCVTRHTGRTFRGTKCGLQQRKREELMTQLPALAAASTLKY